MQRICIWKPKIRQTLITTVGQLHDVIDSEYPTLKYLPQYSRLLADAERHLALVDTVGNTSHLQRGALSQLARKYGFTPQRTSKFLRHGTRPRLYWFIQRCISKTEAQIILAEIYQRNCELHSLEDVLQRLATYYTYESLAQAKDHTSRLKNVQKYFLSLRLLEEGGLYKMAAKVLETSAECVRSWFHEKRRPDLVHLACQIPQETPKLGYKWLPTKIEVGHGFHPTGFIQAPVIISSWHQIQDVLNQLVPLKNREMQRWQKRFGEISQEHSYAYTLGMLVSDAGKYGNYTSTRLDLRLARIYHWSEQVGEAMCYYLGQLGIHAYRKDNDPKNHRWQSQMTPLLRWAKQSCLGLETYQTTAHSQIKAEWLLKAPHDIRLKFLQGLSDGDGWASVSAQRIGISSTVNGDFIQELLQTFAIESRFTIHGRNVEIKKVASIIRSTELPFFLHATGRQANAEKIAKMLRIRKTQKRRPISSTTIEHIMSLHKEGNTPGRIAEILYDQYGLSYRNESIRVIIRRKTKAIES
ncbi:MAG: LAGLIDADG family homing endonuclease [Promethearchaeota archaeon]